MRKDKNMSGRKKEIWREKNDEQENNVSLKEWKSNISVHGRKRKKKCAWAKNKK